MKLIAIGLMLVVLAGLGNGQGLSERVDRYMRDRMKGLDIPGAALAIVKDGKVIKRGEYGFANLNFDVPVKKDTRFLLASITKQFTAAGIMLLVQDGKVGLDDPISKYLDDVPDSWKAITVRNLLTHTAGLRDRFEGDNQALWQLTYSTSQMFEHAKKVPTDFAPGVQFQYSDQGFFLLGMIIEKESGEPYIKFLTERIFKPLGMNDTTTVSQSQIQKNLASGYRMFGDKLYNNRRTTEYGLVSHFGMITSVQDMVKWDAALNTDKPLTESSKRLMWAPAKLNDGSTSAAPGGSYGLGWFLGSQFGHRVVQHGGSTGTAFFRLPDDHVTVILLANLDLLDAPGLASDIAAMVVPDLDWSTHKKATDPDPAFTQVARDELDKMKLGKIDPSVYTEAAAKQIAPVVTAQAATLKEIGEVRNVDYLATDRVGTNSIVRYRVRFKELTIDYSITLDKNRKITNIVGVPE